MYYQEFCAKAEEKLKGGRNVAILLKDSTVNDLIWEAHQANGTTQNCSNNKQEQRVVEIVGDHISITFGSDTICIEPDYYTESDLVAHWILRSFKEYQISLMDPFKEVVAI